MYEIAADSTDPIYTAVQNARLAPVLASFPVKAIGATGAPVVDVTELFTTDIPEFSPGVYVNRAARNRIGHDLRLFNRSRACLSFQPLPASADRPEGRHSTIATTAAHPRRNLSTR